MDTDALVGEIESRGATWVRGEYVNQDTPVTIRCPVPTCGQEFTRTWRVIKRSEQLWCRSCALASGFAKQAFSEDEVRADLRARGIELLDPYRNSQTSIRMRCLPRDGCSGGVEFRNAYNNIRKNNVRTCPKCTWKRRSFELRVPIERVRQDFRDRGAEPLFEDYPGNNVPLLFRCSTPDCENTNSIRYDELQSGGTKPLCKTCSRAALPRGPKHHNWNPSLTEWDRQKTAYGRGQGFVDWEREVFRQFRRHCFITGREGGKLSAHHLYAWNAYPALRYVPGNGVLIDSGLHDEFHDRYGWGDNTYAQFAEFFLEKAGYEFPIRDPMEVANGDV